MEFFTWEQALTYAGAALVVTLIVQFIKGFALPTNPNVMRAIAYGVSVVLMNLAAYFTGQWNPQFAGLSFINSILVTLSALGEYELIKAAGVYKSTATLVAMKAMSKK